MGQKLGNALILFGSLPMLLSLVLLPAAFSQHQDESILGAGVCAFSFGALLIATGLYLKARAIQESTAVVAAKPQPKQQRSGCDLCGIETPAIHCRTHQLHMCPTCLARHFDARSCVYIPSTRRPAAKAAWA